VVGLLVRCCEAAEYDDVLVRDLVETAALEADPVGVLFDAQVEGLPVLASTDVVLFYQVGALATIEASNDVEGLVIEGDRGVEVSPGVQTCDLRPGVTRDIVHLALVHRLTREGTSDRVDLRAASSSEH